MIDHQIIGSHPGTVRVAHRSLAIEGTFSAFTELRGHEKSNNTQT